jgi:hypothetical protein
MTDVKLSGSGPGTDTELQIDSLFQALRASLRPYDWAPPGVASVAAGGHFFFEAATGALTGAAANSPLMSLRWDDSNLSLVLLRLSMWYYLTTAYTAAQMNDFELVRATLFAAADSGGTPVVPLKKRTNMPNSRVQDLRVASTAALTAGTRTLDAAGFGVVVDGPPNVAIPTATLGIPRQELVLYDVREVGAHPLVIGKNEGLIVRNITAMSAAGVIKAYFEADWAEVAVF